MKGRTTICGVLIYVLFVACGGRSQPKSPISPTQENSPVTIQSPQEQAPESVSNIDSNDLIQPKDWQYLGAFRLPGGYERLKTFAYGGNAMTFNPDGDTSGPDDGFPGSLFITGHDRMPYGELPDGNQVAEISIPQPKIAKQLSQLKQAQFLQTFHPVTGHLFDGLDEIPRVGMEYLKLPGGQGKIHLAWGQHFQEEKETQKPSHAWFEPDLSNPNPKGAWFIGERSLYSVNDYLFEIPQQWSERNLGGRYLATGRFRDGGWSGQGPSLFAYSPWINGQGRPAPPGTRLKELMLLQYPSSRSQERTDHAMQNYQHPDEWSGGAWITTQSGKTAVIFAGTKGIGEKYWYGWIHPDGAEYPCVETQFVAEFPVCRWSDGRPCPREDLKGCAGHSDFRGWWSSQFSAQVIFYNPDDLAKVLRQEIPSYAPQPYASLTLDPHLYLNPSNVEPDMLGTGTQRIHRLGSVAYDRANHRIYILELFADKTKPVVHVWSIQ